MNPKSSKYETEALSKLDYQFTYSRKPSEHPNAGPIHFFLAVFYGNKFGRTHKPQDLKNWIKATRTAAECLTEAEKREDTMFKNYASLLWLLLPLSRFLDSKCTDMEDLDKTISMVSQEISSTFNESSDNFFRADLTVFQARLFNLRFARTSLGEDLDYMLNLLTNCPKEQENSAAIWNNLGIARRLKYSLLSNNSDPNNAFPVLNEAVDALYRSTTVRTPGNHRPNAARLGRYSEALIQRFKMTSDKRDLNTAILSIIKALELVNDARQTKLIEFLTTYTSHVEATGGQQTDHILEALKQAIDIVVVNCDISEDWPLDPPDPKSINRVKEMKDVKDVIQLLQTMLQSQLPPDDLFTKLLCQLLGLKMSDERTSAPANAPENKGRLTPAVITREPQQARWPLGTTGLQNMGTPHINIAQLNSR
jgi:hypothetical protein